MLTDRRYRARHACIFALSLALMGTLSAQSSAPSAAAPRTQSEGQAPTFSSHVKVVNVLATVRDKDGKIVRDMNKEDFQLEEDGRPQAIKYFSRETDMPLTLGLLVDTSVSQLRVLGQEKTASYQFLDQMMRPEKDKAFVIHFDSEVELLQDVTANMQKLQAALDAVDAPDNGGFQRRNFGTSNFQRGGRRGGGYPGGGGQRGGRGGSPGGMRGGGTLLYDGVYLADDEITGKQQGRKALIILTDGVDNGSKFSLSSAIESAQRADTVVYSILFEDKSAYGPFGVGRMGRPNGKKVLQQLSDETGGRMFEVSNKLPIEQIYAQIQEELRSQYSLGYTPEKSDEATGYRKIRVQTKRKGVIVQARDGYYATP